jgi:hypothetical protein
MTTAIHDLLSVLGARFGRLDNSPEGWSEQTASLQELNPQVADALAACFGQDSEPVGTYQQAVETFQGLISELASEDRLARGHLNLRFFIMLNGFLAACRETLEKSAFDSQLNAAELVMRSYYAPYFFDRVTLSTSEVITMVEDDIRQLQTLPDTPQGRAAGGRILKGTALALGENYCPRHPQFFVLVAQLETFRIPRDQASLHAATDLLFTIRLAVDNEAKKGE